LHRTGRSAAGVTISLNQDVHGKSLSTVMLEIQLPDEAAAVE
jgi:hypothetical protein